MKKEEFDIPVPIMVIALAIVISVGLYLFVGFTQYGSVAKFLEAHGSLIAGMLGIVGVFVLVWNQNKSTQKTVDATLRAIRLESFEIKRREDLKELNDIYILIDNTEPTERGIDKNTLRSIRSNLQRLTISKRDEVRARIFLLESYFILLQSLSNFVAEKGVVERMWQKSEFLPIENVRRDIFHALQHIKQELIKHSAWSRHREQCLKQLTLVFKGEIELNKLAISEGVELYSGITKKYILEVSKVLPFFNPLLKSVIEHIGNLEAEDHA